MKLNEHMTHCTVWTWVAGDKYLNNALGCTCGFREQVAEEQRLLSTRYRPLKSLGMSEDDWLRTLGIDPEG